MNPYEILGISKSASKEEIKKAYKDIALKCHPDKLHNYNEKEKNERIEKFKLASSAYDILYNDKNVNMFNNINNFDYSDFKDASFFTPEYWKETWKTFFKEDETAEILKDTFIDVASIFINNKIKPRSFYMPTDSCEIIKHNIKLPVSYYEVYCNIKKKLRLFLNDIEEPIFLDIYCGTYPKIVKNYLDDDNKEHEIIINLILKKNNDISSPTYSHTIDDDNKINLITSIEISLKDYINGLTTEIYFINKKNIEITIPPFEKDYITKTGYGLLNGGDLIINIIVKIFEKTEWDKINNIDKDNMIRILNAL